MGYRGSWSFGSAASAHGGDRRVCLAAVDRAEMTTARPSPINPRSKNPKHCSTLANAAAPLTCQRSAAAV
jgi:hypothetical protein